MVERDEQVRRAGHVLGRAFADDPVWSWVVRGSGREQRLVQAFTAFARTAARTPGAEVLVGAEGRAAALWLPPGGWRPSLAGSLQSVPAVLASLRGGVARGARLQAVTARAHPAEPHWYLEALGALPEARGTGAGGHVVRPLLDRCDDAGLPAYLESSNPRNWSFYERHGFVRGTPLGVPRGCPPLVPFRRAPR